MATMITPKLPGPAELAPYLEKLEAAPGSIVLVAIEVPEVCNYARATCAWLSKQEREAIRRALEVCRKKRENSPARYPAPAGNTKSHATELLARRNDEILPPIEGAACPKEAAGRHHISNL